MNPRDQPGLAVTFQDCDWKETADPAKVVFFSFNCQRNPGRRHYTLPIAGRVVWKRDGQNQNGGTAQWDWDGNMQAPTVTPSIHCKGCCHGYITRGAWDDRGAG